MKFTGFLKEKSFSLILLVCVEVLIWFALALFSTHIVGILFVELTIGIAFAAALLYDYSKKRTFFTDLEKTTAELEKKYLLSELIDRPTFYEGQVLYDALAASNKAMNDEIARHKNSADEYREYIETWIHEVKTPIAASKLIIENSKGGESQRSFAETLRSLDEEQARIETLVEQALFYARSSNLEQDYVIKRVSLDALVKDAVKKHSRALIESGITPRFGELKFEVFGDPKWLDFIIGQIITNAIRYRNETAPSLIFSAVRRGSSTFLTIVDNGIGISSVDLPRVFQKGFTGEHGRQFAKTTGIGLYLCKRMCEKMGLGILIDSALDEGTTVEIEFPENRILLGALEE